MKDALQKAEEQARNAEEKEKSILSKWKSSH